MKKRSFRTWFPFVRIDRSDDSSRGLVGGGYIIDPNGSKHKRRLPLKRIALCCAAILGVGFSGFIPWIVTMWLSGRKEATPPVVRDPVVLTRGGRAPIPSDVDPKMMDVVSPPSIQVTAQDRKPMPKDAVQAFFGKPGRHSPSEGLPLVSGDALSVKPSQEGRFLVATVSTEGLMKDQYEKTPHGIYKTLFKVTNRYGMNSPDSTLLFRYLYDEEFKNLDEALIAKAHGFTSISAEGGLEIRNQSQTEGYVSAVLKQRFDFTTDICIRGSFTVESSTAVPPALEIALCGTFEGEQLAFILGDGGCGVYSIKVGREPYGEEPVTKGLPKGSAVYRIVADGQTRNHFAIQLCCLKSGKWKCRLLVKGVPPDLENDDDVHNRILDKPVGKPEITKLRIKVWRAGTVKLYDLRVEELPKH